MTTNVLYKTEDDTVLVDVPNPQPPDTPPDGGNDPPLHSPTPPEDPPPPPDVDLFPKDVYYFRDYPGGPVTGVMVCGDDGCVVTYY